MTEGDCIKFSSLCTDASSLQKKTWRACIFTQATSSLDCLNEIKLCMDSLKYYRRYMPNLIFLFMTLIFLVACGITTLVLLAQKGRLVR